MCNMTVCEKNLRFIDLVIGNTIKMSYRESFCTNSSLGCFIKDGKFIVTDRVSAFFFFFRMDCAGWFILILIGIYLASFYHGYNAYMDQQTS